MRNGKKLWSLLLALIMVISLFGGISLVGAAEDSVTVTPDATVGGETVTMTATGLDDQVAVFDMSAFGMSGINYGFWFDHNGTFSFDKDVTMCTILVRYRACHIIPNYWAFFLLPDGLCLKKLI